MIARSLLILGLVSLLPVAGLAAPSARLKVDAKGSLRIPAATIKALHVKMARDGSFWVQFPQPHRPAPKPPKQAPDKPTGHYDPHDHMVAPSALKVLTALDRGVAVVPHTRLEQGVAVPDRAGTVYLATAAGNTLVLSRQ